LTRLGSDLIIDAIKGHDYYILNIREFLYLKYILGSFRPNIRQWYVQYFCAIIDDSNSKIVITYIDNNPIFWSLDKKYNGRVKFLTIQNGARFFSSKQDQKHYIRHLFYYHSDLIYHSNFVCISDYDIDLYKKNKATVKKFYPIGVLSASTYIENYIERENIFELCLVANSINTRPVNLKILEYFFKYVESSGVSACVALKRSYMSDDFIKHMHEFDRYYGNTTVILVPNNKIGIDTKVLKNRMSTSRPISSSQYLSDVSNVTIGFASSLLRQTFSRGNKIYPINFETKDLDAPFNLIDINLRPSYEEFKQYLDTLRSMDEHEYFLCNKDLMRYFDIFDKNKAPSEKLKNIIDEFLV